MTICNDMLMSQTNPRTKHCFGIIFHLYYRQLSVYTQQRNEDIKWRTEEKKIENRK